LKILLIVSGDQGQRGRNQYGQCDQMLFHKTPIMIQTFQPSSRHDRAASIMRDLGGDFDDFMSLIASSRSTR
jgi:hypothetical protein